MNVPNEQTAPSPDPSSSASAPPSASALPTSENECANCGDSLTGTYCATCGQRAANRVVPLWQVTNEFLEDLVDLDLRILKTLPTFFLKPGQLTVEYVHGRRRRYIRPLRLYLFSSFLLFTVLALTSMSGFSFSFAPSTEAQEELAAVRAELETVRANLTQQMQQAPPESLPTPDTSAPDTARQTAALQGPVRTQTSASVQPKAPEFLTSLDAALAAVEEGMASQQPTDAGLAPPALVETVGKIAETQAESSLEPKILRLLHDPGQIVESMIDRAPYLMFLLVPTFALLLKLLYLRRGRLYLEHLIFALHVHALAFIVFALSSGVGALDLGTSLHLDWWLAASPFGYLFFALRRVYGQSLAATARKTLVLLFAYGILLVAAVAILAMATVALM